MVLRKTHFSENLVNFHEILVKNVFISPKRLQNTILLMCSYCYYLVLTFYRPKTMFKAYNLNICNEFHENDLILAHFCIVIP